MQPIKWYIADIEIDSDYFGPNELVESIDVTIVSADDKRLIRVNSLDGQGIIKHKRTPVRFSFYYKPYSKLQNSYEIYLGFKLIGRILNLKDLEL
jgi:hypothetical protein